MRLLSDFDGVWTDPAAEAEAQGRYLDRTLVEWMPEGSRAQVAGWLRAARSASVREPGRYGWTSEGRLSAFADEDPFVAHSALLHYISEHAGSDATAARLLQAIEQHGFDLDSFGGHTHQAGVREVAERRGPGILATAAEAGRQLLAGGVEVVVASNSSTDKLDRWFEHAGVPRTLHPERSGGAIRLRGSARKFILDPETRDPLDLGGIPIETARPHYHALLLDECPGAVVGDVFSLDLALPLALRMRQPEFSRLRIFWLIRPYTPEWLRTRVARSWGGAIEPIEGGLPALSEILLDGTPAPAARPGAGRRKPKPSPPAR